MMISDCVVDFIDDFYHHHFIYYSERVSAEHIYNYYRHHGCSIYSMNELESAFAIPVFHIGEVVAIALQHVYMYVNNK